MAIQRVDYVDQPYAAPRYSDRESQYGRTLADLMRQRGDREADMYLRQGDIAAQGWANAGGAITNAVAGWQRNVQENRQRELDAARDARTEETHGMQMESAKIDLATKQRKEKGAATERAVLPLALRENGVVGYDRDLIQREMETAGHADLVPDIFARLDEQETGHLKVIEARRDAIAGDAWRVLQGGDTSPETFGAMLDLWGENDLAPKRELDALRKAAEKEGPERALLAAVESSPRFAEMLQKARTANAPKLHNVAPGTSVIDERNPSAGALFTAPQEPKTPTNIEQAILQATDPAERQRLIALKEQFARAGRTPVQPAQPPAPSYTPRTITVDGREVVANYDARTGKYHDPDTGDVLTGVRQPPTADMRNKAAARSFVAKSITAIEDLSKKVITKRGVAQRAVAAGRSVEAALGNDPEYRTYQDARQALAGNLAVAQQGARPSDADIKAIWLPMVPDMFRDTDESATMKWDLIRTMSLPDAPGGGLVTLRAPDGTTQDVDPSMVEHYTSLGATMVKK